MADDASTQSTQEVPALQHETEPSPQSPLGAQQAGEPSGPSPEVLVGGAFVGGFVLAKVLKKLGGGD
jgi:hypothetical protein